MNEPCMYCTKASQPNVFLFSIPSGGFRPKSSWHVEKSLKASTGLRSDTSKMLLSLILENSSNETSTEFESSNSTFET